MGEFSINNVKLSTEQRGTSSQCNKKSELPSIYMSDAEYVDGTTSNIDELIITEKSNGTDNADAAATEKNRIANKMYNKWHEVFPNSPGVGFYLKLYDVISTLHCSVKKANFNKKYYSSLKEQTMDEVIAIFAREAQLNPKTKHGIYYGLFQLAQAGMTDSKKWAKANPKVPGMANISQSMTMDKFRKLSGEQQLDYLVAYIGFSREYSHLKADESITPGQLWAMIKFPSKGKNRSLINQKQNIINGTFDNHDYKNIKRGIK